MTRLTVKLLNWKMSLKIYRYFMEKIEKWIPQAGDTVRLKGTEKPLYHLCKRTDYGMFSFVQIMENATGGGEISEYSLMKDYELVERPQKLEDFLNDMITKPILENMNKTRFEKFGNVMIDLETLSTHNNAAIIEIGAVEFNKYTGEVGEKFNVIIDPKDWCKNDRHVDGETIQWWFNQTNEARKRFTRKNNAYVTLKQALCQLRYFIMDCDTVDDDKDVVVWGNGATMDISILESAFNYFDIEVPWKFWAVNDVRTIVDLNPSIKKNCEFDCGVRHSAIADCLYQIKYTTDTIKSLKLKS